MFDADPWYHCEVEVDFGNGNNNKIMTWYMQIENTARGVLDRKSEHKKTEWREGYLYLLKLIKKTLYW